eukprot:jgi/Ulvmu1/115/UM001_0119.1
MSAWHDWATGSSYYGAIVAVLGCGLTLSPLFVPQTPVRPRHFASHANAAQNYVRRFRGAPTSVLAPLSQESLQEARHDGKELSLSKLTYDGLMYASALSFKAAFSQATGKSPTGAADGKGEDKVLNMVPQACMITERARVVHAMIVERMAQTNDTSVLTSMQQQRDARATVKYHLAWASFMWLCIRSRYTNISPECCAPLVAIANTAAATPIPTPSTYLLSPNAVVDLLPIEALTAISPASAYSAPLATAAMVFFVFKMYCHRAIHIPNAAWERVMHQSVVRHDQALSKGAWVPEACIVGGAAADLLALLAVAAVPAVHSNPGPAMALMLFSLLTALAIPLSAAEGDDPKSVHLCSHPVPAPDLQSAAVRKRLEARLKAALRLAEQVNAGLPWPDSDSAARSRSIDVDVDVDGSVSAAGGASRRNEAQPWAADDAEFMAVLAKAGSPAQHAPPVSRQGPRPLRHAVTPAHVRLHTERALAVLSLAITATAERGRVSASTLLAADEPRGSHDLDPRLLTVHAATESLDSFGGGAADVPSVGDTAAALEAIAELVVAADALLDFLKQSAVDIGPLEFHRAMLYHAAYDMARKAGQHAAQRAHGYVDRARAAAEAALAWTPLTAIAQRGRVHLVLAMALSSLDRPHNALRHAVLGAKCLPGQLHAGHMVALLSRDASVKGQGRAGVKADAEDSAQREAMLDDLARVMLFIEEAQRAAKSAKAG